MYISGPVCFDIQYDMRWRDVIRKTKIKPTLEPAKEFDVELDCNRLEKAMKGIGSNKGEIIDVMCRRSVYQRLAIVRKYKACFGEDLVKRFKSELSGNLKELILCLCYSPAECDAVQLYHAIKGIGTDEDVLIEILCTRTNKQLENIKNIYTQKYNRTLENDVNGDTSGDFRRVLSALLQAQRDESEEVNSAMVEKDTDLLYAAGEAKWGTEESKFIQILASRSDNHLLAIFDLYQIKFNKDISQAIESETSGNFRKTLLTIVRFTRNSTRYFAGRLVDSMKGLGTNDNLLIRVIVSRCEVDLEDIKHQFEGLGKGSLQKWIKDDTSGDYRKALLTLVGGTDDGKM